MSLLVETWTAIARGGFDEFSIHGGFDESQIFDGPYMKWCRR